MSAPVLVTPYRHLRGVHCATAALRNLLYHYTGIALSESLVFGIASGLNFSYVRLNGAPIVTTMGRGTDLEGAFADALGGAVEPSVFYERAAAWSYVKSQLDLNQPLMLDTDMFLLPYITEGLDPSLRQLHFGGHKVLIVGYDEAAGLVMLADYAWDSLQYLTFDQLAAARSTPNCPSPPQNRAFRFVFTEPLASVPVAIIAGLNRMTALMRNSLGVFTGLPGLDRFCRQVCRWDRLLNASEFKVNTLLASHMMERGGSGGGNFRLLYSRFLIEASELLGDERLFSISLVYRELAQRWSILAKLLKQASDQPDQGLFNPNEHGKLLLDEIWRLENEGVCAIEHFLNHRKRYAGRAIEWPRRSFISPIRNITAGGLGERLTEVV